MGFFFLGAGLLASVIGLFYLKDELRIVWLARLAYSELVMRIAVIAATMTFIGLLLIISEFLAAN
jgi:hypothetical protein